MLMIQMLIQMQEVIRTNSLVDEYDFAAIKNNKIITIIFNLYTITESMLWYNQHRILYL